MSVRYLDLILGDQLDHQSALWKKHDLTQDRVAMFEVTSESLAPLSGFNRTLLFICCMRSYAGELKQQGIQLDYYDLSSQLRNFSEGIKLVFETYQPEKFRCVLPGDVRVYDEIKQTFQSLNVAYEFLSDDHFIANPGEFSQWLKKYKRPRMEYWYRYLRLRTNVLINSEGQPEGNRWNFDKDNRKAFGKQGPEQSFVGVRFDNTDLIRSVLQDIDTYLADLPGRTATESPQPLFPVNRQQALLLLADFIDKKLPYFGDYQDAMWTEEPFLYHSLLSTSLNLKLLMPLEVIQQAEQAYYDQKAPLHAVEGFIRQILGWREYVRGMYWTYHDQWRHANALNAQQRLPDFYWSSETEMQCLHQSLKQVIAFGYGHHIQRLMVTGLFALLYGVAPKEIEEWYLAMYCDAISWVEVPNTLGMSQYADGGLIASKPYIASGNYIDKMSNYCKKCKYQPQLAHGDDACPITTLYWNFINENQPLILSNPRLGVQVKNWQRKKTSEQNNIIKRKKWIIDNINSV